jgi:tetratricopeptide (TPR) repeat protein
MRVPESVAIRIMAQLATVLAADDETLTDPIAMAMRGALARKLGHFQRAERLARRALAIQPGYLGAIALLSSVLRSTDRVDEALALTAPHAHCNEPAVLTTRAAALQDEGRSNEAVRMAKRAWAISLGLPGGPSEELRNLYARLRAEGAI